MAKTVAATKAVIEFSVVDDDLEVKFRANADTKISKVWDSYAQNRKWQADEGSRFRLFVNDSEGVKLGGTIQSNGVTNGSRLYVYELDPEERCRVTICDQYGNENTFEGWIEDDVEYWAQAFRTAVWSGRGVTSGVPTPQPMQLSERFTLYDFGTRAKVDLAGTTPGQPPLIGQFTEDHYDDDEDEEYQQAAFLCFRYMPLHPAKPLTVSFWFWNGDHIDIETDADAPVLEAASACTFLLLGARAARNVSPSSIFLYKRGVLLDVGQQRAGSLIVNRTLPQQGAGGGAGGGGGGRGDLDDEVDDLQRRWRRGAIPAAGCGATEAVDVDYITELSQGGAVQLGAWRNALTLESIKAVCSLWGVGPGDFSAQAAGPLLLAAVNGAAAAVSALLEWGLDPAAGHCGCTENAEYAAALHGHEEVVRVLLRHGSGAMVACGNQLAALGRKLQAAVRETGGSRGFSLGCSCACVNMCQRKLVLMSDPNPRELALAGQLLYIPLIAAAARGHEGVVRALLEAGYPPDVQDYTGETALAAAAARGHVGVVRLLLGAGAAAGHRSLDGETPLHGAAAAGEAEVCKLLLASGADAEAQSDVLLAFSELAKLTGRKFRNAHELGEWYRRQPRASRIAILDAGSALGGCTPLSLAVAGGWREAVVVLLESVGCSGRQPLSKAKSDMLQGLLALATTRGHGTLAALLLERLQGGSGGGAGATVVLPTAGSGGRSSNMAGSSSRSRNATRSVARGAAAAMAAAAATVSPGSSVSSILMAVATTAVPFGGRWSLTEEETAAAMFAVPEGLMSAVRVAAAASGQRQQQQRPVGQHPTQQQQRQQQQQKRQPETQGAQGQGQNSDQQSGVASSANSHKGTRKAGAAAGSATQAQKRQQAPNQQQQQRQRQQRQQQPPSQRPVEQEGSMAEEAGVQLREFIQKERQQLRRKLGLDTEAAAEGGAGGGSAAATGAVTKAGAAVSGAGMQNSALAGGGGGAAAASASSSSAVSAGAGVGDGQGGHAAVEPPCRCCLRHEALEQEVLGKATAAGAAPAAAAAGLSRNGKKGDGGDVQRLAGLCEVDSEYGMVGLRQRRLVVRCSGGCQLAYHYPDCWRRLEAMLRAARPDYHGLKGPGGAKSHPPTLPCWSPGCTGTLLSATVLEGPTSQPRFRQQLYTSPGLAQAQAAEKAAAKHGAQRTATTGQQIGPAAAATAASGAEQVAQQVGAAVGGKGGTAGRYGSTAAKLWQEQSWYGGYEEESEEGAGEGGEEGEVEGEGEEEVETAPRAAELVDLSAVKLVPLSRVRHGDVVEGVGAGAGRGGAHGAGAGGEEEAECSLDDVEAAPMVVEGRGKGRRGGGMRLKLTEFVTRDEGGGGGGGPSGGQHNHHNQQRFNHPHHNQHQAPGAGGGGGVAAWRDANLLPFSVRPVWGDKTGMAGGTAAAEDQGMYAAPAGGATSHAHPHGGGAAGSHGPQNGAIESGYGHGSGGGGRGSSSLVAIQITDEEFPSLLGSGGPGGPAGQHQSTAGGEEAEDPIIRALQLLKAPGADIITPHLLLEGLCLRNLYGTLFRGRPRIADSQLMSVLDRYGAMTAFQSFEGGAAVAVSFRNEGVAGAVTAGLAAGDAVGLLGPGSAAGAGGLCVSCLLEFPTDDTLAREMLQAERAAGGGVRRGGGSDGASKLKVDAVPFVPGRLGAVVSVQAAAAVSKPISPGAATRGVHANGRRADVASPPPPPPSSSLPRTVRQEDANRGGGASGWFVDEQEPLPLPLAAAAANTAQRGFDLPAASGTDNAGGGGSTWDIAPASPARRPSYDTERAPSTVLDVTDTTTSVAAPVAPPDGPLPAAPPPRTTVPPPPPPPPSPISPISPPQAPHAARPPSQPPPGPSLPPPAAVVTISTIRPAGLPPAAAAVPNPTLAVLGLTCTTATPAPAAPPPASLLTAVPLHPRPLVPPPLPVTTALTATAGAPATSASPPASLTRAIPCLPPAAPAPGPAANFSPLPNMPWLAARVNATAAAAHQRAPAGAAVPPHPIPVPVPVPVLLPVPIPVDSEATSADARTAMLFGAQHHEAHETAGAGKAGAGVLAAGSECPLGGAAWTGVEQGSEGRGLHAGDVLGGGEEAEGEDMLAHVLGLCLTGC